MFRAATNQVTTTRGPQKGHLQNSSKQKTGQDGRNIKELTTSLNAVQFVENVPEDEQLPGEMAERAAEAASPETIKRVLLVSRSVDRQRRRSI